MDNEARLEKRKQEEEARKERVKYPMLQFFLRPGEKEKYSEFNAINFPTKMADGSKLSKNLRKKLDKRWMKHKEERENAGFDD